MLIIIIIIFAYSNAFSGEDYLNSPKFKAKPYFEKVKQIEDTFELSENSQLLLKSAEEYKSLVENNNDYKRIPYSYHRLGVANWRLSRFQIAFDLLEKANELAHKYIDTFVIIESGIYQGMIYDTYNWNDKSREKFHKSFYYANLTKRYHDMASCCWNLASAHGLAKNYDSARFYGNEALIYLKMMDDQTSRKAIFAYSLAYMYKGVFHIDQSQWDSSLIYTPKALELSKKINSDIIIPPILNNIMNAYNNLGKYDSVIAIGLRELPVIKRINNYPYLALAYYDIALAYSKLNNYDSAFYYLMLHKVSRDSMVQNDARVTASLHELDNMKAENEIKRLNQNNIIYSIVAALVLLLGITIILYFRFRIKSKINKQQEELNRTKDKLFSLISHDLRTPLHSLNDLIKLINNHYDDFEADERKRYINTLLSSSNKVTQLLENLLYWSRMQLKGISTKPEEVNLKEIILEEVNYQQEQYQKKKIDISINCDDGVEIFVDVGMLRIIIRNLLSNAIKFTKNEGKIDFIVTSNENSISLEIIDNGVGIKEEDKEKLFNFTSNFTSMGTNNEKGTGLGLILIKELAEKNNIKLNFESEVGVGTRFGLEFLV